jgi:hypothetical protein
VTPDVPVPSSPDEPTAAGVPAEADSGAVASAQRAMRLVELVREIEKHVASDGWDQNPRMFALARTVELVALEPEIAEALGAEGHHPESLTPIEQEPLDNERALDDVLATTTWPAAVVGAALVIERLVLPPSAEESLTDEDPAAMESAAANHPDRLDVRMAVLVTRDGGRICALRLRSHDVDDEVLIGEDLVPRLTDALAATLA